MSHTPEKPKKVSIRVQSEPFLNDPEGADVYYLELGRILVLWGRFENHFSHALIALCNMPAAKNFMPTNMPLPFNDKAKLLRKLFQEIDELSALKEEALSLIADASDSAEDRHVVMHGHFNGFIDDDPLTGRFLRHRHQGEKIIFERYDVTIDALHEMTNKIDSLNTRLLPITFNVISPSPTSG